ncbi:MAG: hypothetical protein J6W29_08420, partial [Neisseriaceae bacterium]|nr:hypothetical protein [Neisseriaceae bacterium]
MKIRNNIYAWLYFSPIILSIIWGIIDKSSAGIPLAMIFFLPFALISFIDIKFFKFIRRLVFCFFVWFACLYSTPRFWLIDEEHTFIKLALLFIFIVFIQSIAEYQWHKKFKQHYKKYILIFSLVILYLSHSVYQYIENKK